MNAPGRPADEPTLIRLDWTDHLPILGGALAFLFIIVEAYGVGDFDIPTALALLDAAGATHILLGTLLGFLPYLLPLVLFASIWLALRLHRRAAGWNARTGAWALAVVAGGLSAWRFALVMAIVLGLYVLAVLLVVRAADRRHLRRHGSRSDLRRPRERSPVGPAVVVAAVGFFVVSLTTPWVPPEVIRLNASQAAQFRPGDGFAKSADVLTGTAFVMNEKEGWLTLLAYHDRRAIRVPAAELLSRQVCRKAVPIPRESLGQVLFARSQASQTPECPA